MSGKVEPLDRKEIRATMKMLAGEQELIAHLHSQDQKRTNLTTQMVAVKALGAYIAIT
jgi:hypothetical protein